MSVFVLTVSAVTTTCVCQSSHGDQKETEGESGRTQADQTNTLVLKLIDQEVAGGLQYDQQI